MTYPIKSLPYRTTAKYTHKNHQKLGQNGDKMHMLILSAIFITIHWLAYAPIFPVFLWVQPGTNIETPLR